MDSEHHQAEAEARFEAQPAEMRRPFHLMTWPDGHISLTEGGSGTGFPIGHDPDFARELHEWLNYVVEHREAADEIASLRARVEAMETALVSEREDNLWNAYHSGHVKDGEWDHMCMSDGEWLAHECGFNVKDRRIADADIRAAIPEAARQALKGTPVE